MGKRRDERRQYRADKRQQRYDAKQKRVETRQNARVQSASDRAASWSAVGQGAAGAASAAVGALGASPFGDMLGDALGVDIGPNVDTDRMGGMDLPEATRPEEPGMLDQATEWAKANPLPAAGIAAGGLFLGYKLLGK